MFITIFFLLWSILLPMLSFTSSYALSLTHTLSLFLSLRCLALSPALIVWCKNIGIHFQLIIDYNKLLWFTSLFHLEVAHNTIVINYYHNTFIVHAKGSTFLIVHFKCKFDWHQGFYLILFTSSGVCTKKI